MTFAVLRNETRGTIVAERVATVRTPWGRALGLLGRSALGPDEGLAFPRCDGVHTVAMRVCLDVIFLDHAGAVVRFVRGARPNCVAIRCARAASVIELGTSPDARVAVGDVLRLVQAAA